MLFVVVINCDMHEAYNNDTFSNITHANYKSTKRWVIKFKSSGRKLRIFVQNIDV